MDDTTALSGPADGSPIGDPEPERGQGMVEYAFILMLVALVLIISVQILGHTTENMFSNVSNGLSGAHG